MAGQAHLWAWGPRKEPLSTWVSCLWAVVPEHMWKLLPKPSFLWKTAESVLGAQGGIIPSLYFYVCFRISIIKSHLKNNNNKNTILSIREPLQSLFLHFQVLVTALADAPQPWGDPEASPSREPSLAFWGHLTLRRAERAPAPMAWNHSGWLEKLS